MTIVIDGNRVPARLNALIDSRKWKPPVDKSRWHALVPMDKVIQPTLYPLDKLNGKSLWSSEAGDGFLGVVDQHIVPGKLDPATTIIIGDLGPERLLALDLRVSYSNPPVCAFLPRDDEDSCWVVIAATLDDFIIALGLDD